MTQILVFGTGVLLRGFVADFAEKAGMTITMVSSTPSGDSRAHALSASGGRFTLRERGIVAGAAPAEASLVDTSREVGCIRRALTASEDWDAVLATAGDPTIQIVVSNVSESGFKVTEPKASSFPGRLAAWLRARWKSGGGGVTILPCELIADNGSKLRAMVAECDPNPAFLAWLDAHCRFLDTLVDRICTQDDNDPLAAIVEPYTFWAIRGEKSGALATLADASGGGIVIAADIAYYTTRKVRILNGLHTAMASIGPSQYGVATVLEALDHLELGPWLEHLLQKEILPAICPPLEKGDAQKYAAATLLRMRNPYLVHKLSMINVGAATKWETRLLPTMAAYEERFGMPPPRLSACRQAFLASAGAAG